MTIKINNNININIIYFLVMSLILALLSYLFYVGSLGSDDISYINNAKIITSGAEYIPTSHWGFRYTIIVPLSIALTFITLTEHNIFILNFLINILMMGYIFYLIKSLANITKEKTNHDYLILLFATCPFLVIQLSILNIDLIESNLIVATILNIAIFLCCDNKKYLYTASLIAGLCLITRETSALYLFSIIIAFIAISPKIKPIDYAICIILAASFLIFESCYYLIKTGDAFYHFRVTFHSHLHDQFGDIYKKHGEDTGNILSNTIYEPFTVLLINQEFGLIFYLFFLYIVSSIKKGLEIYQKFFILFFIFAFLLISYSGFIRLLPRYYFSLCMIVIIMISLGFEFKSLFIRRLILAGVVSVNLLCLSIENINPLFHHRSFLEETNKLNSCITTESDLLRRALALSSFSEHNGEYLTKNCQSQYYYLIEGEDQIFLSQHKKSNYELIRNIEPPILLIGRILQAIGMDNYLPKSFFEKLAYRNHRAKIIKIREQT